jgi:hypothetical protein
MSALSIKGDCLLGVHGKEIAALPENISPELKSSYINLFATAPQLLDYLAAEVSSAVNHIEDRSKIRGRVRDGYLYFPKWLDHAAQIVAYAQGIEPNLRGATLCLTKPTGKRAELQDRNENVVLQFSDRLNETEIDRYAKLFIAAPALLEIVEAMSNEGLAAMRKEYETGAQFDPAGAHTYRFIIPDRLKYISDLVSKARGAVPLPETSSLPSREIGQKLWTDAPVDRNTEATGSLHVKEDLRRTGFKTGVAIMVMGLIVLGLMGSTLYKHYELEKYGRYARGAVLGCIDEARHVPESAFWDGKRNFLMPIKYVDKCYRYQIEFQPVSGSKVDIVGGSNTKREEINGAVTILYMASDPKNTAMIDDLPSNGFWILGIVLCLVSLYFFRASRSPN